MVMLKKSTDILELYTEIYTNEILRDFGFASNNPVWGGVGR